MTKARVELGEVVATDKGAILRPVTEANFRISGVLSVDSDSSNVVFSWLEGSQNDLIAQRAIVCESHKVAYTTVEEDELAKQALVSVLRPLVNASYDELVGV